MTQPVRNGDGSGEVSTLIDELLAEQRQLTAVERFSRQHDRHDGPLLQAHYRDLIPLTAPRPGEQYAFEVDLDRCSGCKGCVTACHSLNGLDEDESWREVGFLVGEALVPLNAADPAYVTAAAGGCSAEKRCAELPVPPPANRFGNKVIPLQQTVTTACHHCVEPGCLLGCPVLAYDKDPITGIVRHLDDQCIGCSYCILKCPYDVPKYSARRGIVRKCDMCQGRLAEGEAPACVQACPNEAIHITLVKSAEVRERGQKSVEADFNGWLSDSPSPGATLPTTRYLSSKPPELLRSSDHFNPKPSHAHWPLVLMLVLTQAGIGGLFAVAWLAHGSSTGGPLLAAISFALLAGGLVASAFHLGQPRKAWRVWMGWRTSWLSREAIALNMFAGVATAALVCLWAGRITEAFRLPEWLATLLHRAASVPTSFWGLPLVVAGLASLAAQTMVYADTKRRFWSLPLTLPRFLGSAVVCGLALLFWFNPVASIAAALVVTTLAKIAVEVTVLKHADSDVDRWTQLRRTAALQLGPLRPVLVLRLACALVGGVVLPFLWFVGIGHPGVILGTLALTLLGELAERFLFFTAVAPDKMPGMP